MGAVDQLCVKWPHKDGDLHSGCDCAACGLHPVPAAVSFPSPSTRDLTWVVTPAPPGSPVVIGQI